MKKYNISKPEKYIGKDGQEKTFWANVGTMTEFEKQDGTVSRIIEIPAIGLKANVFEKKDKDDGFEKSYGGGQSAPQKTKASSNPAEQTVEYPEEEINPADIPF